MRYFRFCIRSFSKFEMVLLSLLCCVVIPANCYAIGGTDATEDQTNDGVVRFKIFYSHIPNPKAVPDPEKVQRVGCGFLITPPRGFEKYRGQLAISCGHIFYYGKEFPHVNLKSTIAQSMSGTSVIKKLKIHPNFFDNKNFIDVSLMLLETKLNKEKETPLDYKKDSKISTAIMDAKLAAWGPSTDDEPIDNYKKRTAPMKVRLEKDDDETSIKDPSGEKREFNIKGDTTYSAYYKPEKSSFSKEDIAKYDLFFSKACILEGDSGSRLVVNNGDVAIACMGSWGELEEQRIQELVFTRISSAVKNWIIQTLKEWESGK